jgi:lipid-A-disaccharide synthase
MLCLFPFETQFYQSHNVPALFVGHPLADIIPDETDKVAARKELKLKTEGEIVAILPGSRSNELHYLSEVFIQTAMWCVERRPGLLFVVPLANEHRRKQFEEALSRQDYLPPIRLIDGQSRLAMAAADVVLLASGTATLEALLLKRPMVVSYRVANLTYIIFKTLSTVKYYSLPNLLSGIELVPELLQTRATPENLGVEILAYLEHPDMAANLTQHFSHIHHQLRRNASLQAAQAILNMR